MQEVPGVGGALAHARDRQVVAAGELTTHPCAEHHEIEGSAVGRSKKTKKVTKRTYRCTIRLAKGAWTVTTTARGAAGVVAEGSRRVVVR